MAPAVGCTTGGVKVSGNGALVRQLASTAAIVRFCAVSALSPHRLFTSTHRLT